MPKVSIAFRQTLRRFTDLFSPLVNGLRIVGFSSQSEVDNPSSDSENWSQFLGVHDAETRSMPFQQLIRGILEPRLMPELENTILDNRKGFSSIIPFLLPLTLPKNGSTLKADEAPSPGAPPEGVSA